MDYISSKKALIPSQKYTPAEIGLGKLVHYEKENFIGRQALLEEKLGPKRLLVGLEIDWNEVEALFDRIGLAPQTPATAVPRPCPGLRGTRASRQSDVDYMVAIAETIDCSRQHRDGTSHPGAKCTSR